MPFTKAMPKSLQPYFDRKLKAYQDSLQEANLQQAWRHLEKAHVIGQAYPFQNSYVHWKMLRFGIKIKTGREIRGQIPRLLIGGIKSFVGKIPVGNTGGANVPPLKSLPIEREVADIFEKAGVRPL